jgi:undecaprenyl-phosphate galactose phosphotransferase
MNEKIVELSLIDSASWSNKKAFYFFLKRIFDIVVSLVGVIFLLPIYLVVKISYILSGDFHSVIYFHNRVGKDGKIFKLYKFRSMCYNADEKLKELLKQEKYKKEWKLNQKLDNDPRITKIGKVLRKTSLDELPQLLNVLKGDMSFIGPRPLIIGELDEHNGNHKIYESVKPGITGWWAANGRSSTTYKKRLELEYYYVNNCSIILDIKCFIRTVKAVIFRNGAK